MMKQKGKLGIHHSDCASQFHLNFTPFRLHIMKQPKYNVDYTDCSAASPSAAPQHDDELI
eukprot:2256447-Pleurochrysis_carterae.AAC.3